MEPFLYMIKSILLLENGEFFLGTSFGFVGEAVGEVCFNTGMTGYQEILTDPSYCQQLVALTYPHIGNYGVNNHDIESAKIQVGGIIVKEGCSYPSNYRSIKSIEDYLIENKIVGIQKVDTRKLTRIIRHEGSMNGIISSLDFDKNSLTNKLDEAPKMEGLDLCKKVSCKQPYLWEASKGNKYRVAVIDYGIKYNILRILEKNDCELMIYPSDVTSKDLLESNLNGIFLSNGPGDPSAVDYGIKTVKEILGKKPLFGICLGHQILALALGAKTYKLKFGHRGCNHPVKNLLTNSVEITSQNHGFSIDKSSIPNLIQITHESLNDNTIEGIYCKKYNAFSVQYHPESSPGPNDSKYLFDKFINMMDIDQSA